MRSEVGTDQSNRTLFVNMDALVWCKPDVIGKLQIGHSVISPTQP